MTSVFCLFHISDSGKKKMEEENCVDVKVDVKVVFSYGKNHKQDILNKIKIRA